VQCLRRRAGSPQAAEAVGVPLMAYGVLATAGQWHAAHYGAASTITWS